MVWLLFFFTCVIRFIIQPPFVFVISIMPFSLKWKHDKGEVQVKSVLEQLSLVI